MNELEFNLIIKQIEKAKTVKILKELIDKYKRSFIPQPYETLIILKSIQKLKEKSIKAFESLPLYLRNKSVVDFTWEDYKKMSKSIKNLDKSPECKFNIEINETNIVEATEFLMPDNNINLNFNLTNHRKEELQKVLYGGRLYFYSHESNNNIFAYEKYIILKAVSEKEDSINTLFKKIMQNTYDKINFEELYTDLDNKYKEIIKDKNNLEKQIKQLDNTLNILKEKI
jgi:hypothetical protein